MWRARDNPQDGESERKRKAQQVARGPRRPLQGGWPGAWLEGSRGTRTSRRSCSLLAEKEPTVSVGRQATSGFLSQGGHRRNLEAIPEVAEFVGREDRLLQGLEPADRNSVNYNRARKLAGECSPGLLLLRSTCSPTREGKPARVGCGTRLPEGWHKGRTMRGVQNPSFFRTTTGLCTVALGSSVKQGNACTHTIHHAQNQ